MHQHRDEQLVGTSVAIRTVLEDIGYAAGTDAKVLITGESGVGKEIVAHRLHGSSRRSQAPFITLNCAGVPESLLESELFGHTRGSFTGAWRDRAGVLELAHGGTLFMDEVGEMSLRMQALLLRFLETGEIQRVGADQPHTPVNVRLITATNRDLLQQIRAGRVPRRPVLPAERHPHLRSRRCGSERRTCRCWCSTSSSITAGCTASRCRSCRRT